MSSVVLRQNELDDIEINTGDRNDDITLQNTNNRTVKGSTILTGIESRTSLIIPPLMKEKIGPIKKLLIDTHTTATIGEPWTTIKLLQRTKRYLFILYNEFNKRKCILVLYTLYVITITINIVFCTMILQKTYDKNKDMFMTMVIGCTLFFQFVTLYFVFHILIETLRHRTIEDRLIKGVVGLRIFSSLIGILCATGTLFDSLIYAYPLMGSCCLSCIIFMLLCVFLIVSFPLFLILLIAEFIGRIFMGKLSCPKKSPVMLEFTYQKYKYNETCFDALKCIICLSELGSEEEIVLLTCHQSHISHENCMVEWITRSKECPICRQILVLVSS